MTTLDLRTASLDELRDYVLGHFGGRYEGAVWWLPVNKQQSWMPGPRRLHPDDGPATDWVYTVHPLPATIDACVAAWNELAPEWWWHRSEMMGGEILWLAGDVPLHRVSVKATDDELLDRWRLLALVLEAKKKDTHTAALA